MLLESYTRFVCDAQLIEYVLASLHAIEVKYLNPNLSTLAVYSSVHFGLLVRLASVRLRTVVEWSNTTCAKVKTPYYISDLAMVNSIRG